MNDHCSVPVTGPQTLAGDRYELSVQILEVRAVLVSQLFRGKRMSIGDCWTPALDRAWTLFQQSVAQGNRQVIADNDWALRVAVFQSVGNGLVLSLLLQGDERLQQACGGRPPAVDISGRLAAMQTLVNASKAGEVSEAMAAAITQVALDQCDLKSVMTQH